MTIQEAIDKIDRLKPNKFSQAQKIAWLSDLDKMVWREVLLAHEGVPVGATFDGYNEDTPPDTELLVPSPYSDIYQHYFATQMDMANMENTKYSQDSILFANAWTTFGDYWTRTHMPITRVREYRL